MKSVFIYILVMDTKDNIGELNYFGVFEIYDDRHTIEHLPLNIFNHKYSPIIDIHDCPKLKEIPENIGQLKNLTTLKITATGIQSLPNTIGNLENLRYLEIRHNYNLYELPETIGNLKKLEVLNIEHGKLTSLPESIGELQNLQYLYVKKNNLKFLPDSIGKLLNIRYINVRSNLLESLPESIWDWKNIDISDNPRWNYWKEETDKAYYEALGKKSKR